MLIKIVPCQLRRARAWIVPLVFIPTLLAAADWPQWRGPKRDGAAVDSALPAKLPSELRQVWRVEVGEGHSSPVAVGDRVYVFARQGEEEVLRALDLASGAEVWRRATEVPYTMNPAAGSHGKGPKSTPVVWEGSVCVLGITGILSCFDRESGEQRFSHDFRDRFSRTHPDFGTAMSPAVLDGRLVAHVGGIKDGALVAFDLARGSEIWSLEEPPAYASPVAGEIAGVEQIVTQSRTHVLGVAADDGRPLWRIGLTTPFNQNSVTPVIYGSRVILSGLDQSLFALQVSRGSDGSFATERVWNHDDLPLYMSSPVLHGDLLFGLSNKRKGELFCVDAATGEVRWTSEGRDGDNASLIVAGDRLLVLNDSAELRIAPAVASGFVPEASYTVADSPTWAHPALVGSTILVKDKTQLTAWSFGSD